MSDHRAPWPTWNSSPSNETAVLLRLVLMLLLGIGASAVVWQALTGDRVTGCGDDRICPARTRSPAAASPPAARSEHRPGGFARSHHTVCREVGWHECAPCTREQRAVDTTHHFKEGKAAQSFGSDSHGAEMGSPDPWGSISALSRRLRGSSVRWDRPRDGRGIVGKLPAAVQRNVTRVRAELFSRALGVIGTSVEVRDKQGELDRGAGAGADRGRSQANRAGGSTLRNPPSWQASAAPPPVSLESVHRARDPWMGSDEPDKHHRPAGDGRARSSARRAADAASGLTVGAAAALEPGAAHATVREMNAIAPELASGGARAARSTGAAATFISGPRGGAQPAHATTPARARQARRCSPVHRTWMRHTRREPGNAAPSPAAAAPVFASPASLVERPDALAAAAAAARRWRAGAPGASSRFRPPAAGAGPALAWNNPAPLGRPGASAHGRAWRRACRGGPRRMACRSARRGSLRACRSAAEPRRCARRQPR